MISIYSQVDFGYGRAFSGWVLKQVFPFGRRHQTLSEFKSLFSKQEDLLPLEKPTNFKFMVLGFSVQSHNLSKATLWFLLALSSF